MLPPNQERVGQLVPASNGCSLRHGASRPNTFCGFGERHYTSINSVLNTPPNQATIVHDHHLTENIARVGFNYHLGAPVVAKSNLISISPRTPKPRRRRRFPARCALAFGRQPTPIGGPSTQRIPAVAFDPPQGPSYLCSIPRSAQTENPETCHVVKVAELGSRSPSRRKPKLLRGTPEPYELAPAHDRPKSQCGRVTVRIQRLENAEELFD